MRHSSPRTRRHRRPELLPSALLLIGALTTTFNVASTAAQAPTARSPTASGEPLVIVPRLDLNSATREELLRLPGIGPARADAILTRRRQRVFRRPWELVRVHGIGPRLFRRLREYVRVSPGVGRTRDR